MSKITLSSPAKINLALDILGKDSSSGYHFIQTIFQRIELSDILEFQVSNSESLEIDSNVELPSDNTLKRAYNVLCTEAGKSPGVKIVLKKKIPIGAGLGGASSNAATVLLGLNHLFTLGMHTNRLMEIGATIGMDVPFFVSNASTAFGTGFGEKIISLPQLPAIDLIIIYPRIQRLTRIAYAALAPDSVSRSRHKTDMMCEILRRYPSPADKLIPLIHNDFEESFFRDHQKLLALKQRLEAAGMRKVFLTGSGSSLVAIGTPEILSAEAEKLKRAYRVILTRTS